MDFASVVHHGPGSRRSLRRFRSAAGARVLKGLRRRTPIDHANGIGITGNADPAAVAW
jgi:hypothetical protein